MKVDQLPTAKQRAGIDAEAFPLFPNGGDAPYALEVQLAAKPPQRPASDEYMRGLFDASQPRGWAAGLRRKPPAAPVLESHTQWLEAQASQRQLAATAAREVRDRVTAVAKRAADADEAAERRKATSERRRLASEVANKEKLRHIRADTAMLRQQPSRDAGAALVAARRVEAAASAGRAAAIAAAAARHGAPAQPHSAGAKPPSAPRTGLPAEPQAVNAPLSRRTRAAQDALARSRSMSERVAQMLREEAQAAPAARPVALKLLSSPGGIRGGVSMRPWTSSPSGAWRRPLGPTKGTRPG